MAIDKDELLTYLQRHMTIEVHCGGYLGRALDGVSPLWHDDPGRVRVRVLFDDEEICSAEDRISPEEFKRA